jgi:hypothetical protein
MQAKMTASFARKINCGNYESAEFSLMLSVSCDDDDDLDEVAARLTCQVKSYVYQGIADEAQEASHPSLIIRRFVAGKEIEAMDNF